MKELIAKCKNQERAAQEQLYHLYKDVLFALSMKYCRNREQAQDNLHDAFVTILLTIDKYKGKGSFEGWMKRIVINKAIAKFKSKSHLNVVINEEITEDIYVTQDEIQTIEVNRLLTMVQELPDRYRLVFTMYQLDNFSHQEIADALGISIGTSKSNLHRAKALLKSKLTSLNITSTNKTVNGN